jgi:hypothetical protein
MLTPRKTGEEPGGEVGHTFISSEIASLQDLQFPIVAFGRDGSFTPIPDAEALTTSTYGLKVGAWLEARLVTVGGKQLVVKGVKPGRIAKRWWSRPIFLTLRRVELETEPAGDVTLSEFKDMLLKMFKANRVMWEASLSYDEFASEIRRHSSFRELIDYLVGR